MHRSIKVVLTALLLLAISSRTFADNTIEAFRTAPVWYVQYEVALKVSYEKRDTVSESPHTCAITMDRTFTAISKLDIRSDGPSPVLGASFLSGSADGSKPSAADQMKLAQDMMARMESAANWMSSGGAATDDENASDAESASAGTAIMAAASAPAKFDYLRVDTYDKVVNELGQLLKRKEVTTRKGSGNVLPGGGMTITFEVDAAAKKYTLVLPWGFNDMGTQMTTDAVTTTTDMAGKNPTETKQHNEMGLGNFPSAVTIDDPKNVQAAMALFKGDVDPAMGKITGERTFAAHYEDDRNTSIPGTLTFRYTLTTTPPAKGKTDK